MASTTGTLSWAERTGGKLAWREQLEYIAGGVRAQVALKLRRKGTPPKRIEVGAIVVPDSAIANAATALCADAATPMLFNHSLRSYFWARLLDEGTQPFDDEAFYVASMLHDLGLTDAHRIESERQECFTLAGCTDGDVVSRTAPLE